MTEQTRPNVRLGAYTAHVNEAVARLESDDVVRRLWGGDHTLWRDDPAEIVDRLGWLTVDSTMRHHLADIGAFASAVRADGIRHVVLLGMGGSSLGPEVVRRSIGSASGYPELIVLDSTVPSWIRRVDGAIDLAKTLFLVSSKSGTTIEPNSFYKYFRRRVERTVGAESAGSHFAAITDPGTPLAELAERDGFRRLFEADPDIGGRYSVLSHFGLVPASLVGADAETLLDRASSVSGSARNGTIESNPAAWLGAFMASMAHAGRNKLTLLTSPSIASFGLWVEQLLAESTGKEGKGIIPVAEEPLLETGAYGDDRAFVHMRVDGDDNAAADVATERLAAVGHPLLRLDLADAYHIGAEFFRWEFATAVAGVLLDIHPFDQPNVQAAKDATEAVLGEYQETGELPRVAADGSLTELLTLAEPGDYLAVLAYVDQTPGVDGTLTELRRRVMDRHRLATTFGYGPRYLHSTGQLHKGGPNSGLFLQCVTDEVDLEIPDASYGFATLSAAQAIGDYRALQSAGRRVVRVELGPDAEAGLLRLLAAVP